MFIKALLSNFTCSLYSLVSTVSSRLNFFSLAFLSSSVKELGSTGRRITPTGKWYRVKYEEPSGLITRTLYCKGYFAFFGRYKLNIKQEKHEKSWGMYFCTKNILAWIMLGTPFVKFLCYKYKFSFNEETYELPQHKFQRNKLVKLLLYIIVLG